MHQMLWPCNIFGDMECFVETVGRESVSMMRNLMKQYSEECVQPTYGGVSSMDPCLLLYNSLAIDSHSGKHFNPHICKLCFQ